MYNNGKGSKIIDGNDFCFLNADGLAHDLEEINYFKLKAKMVLCMILVCVGDTLCWGKNVLYKYKFNSSFNDFFFIALYPKVPKILRARFIYLQNLPPFYKRYI